MESLTQNGSNEPQTPSQAQPGTEGLDKPVSLLQSVNPAENALQQPAAEEKTDDVRTLKLGLMKTTMNQLGLAKGNEPEDLLHLVFAALTYVCISPGATTSQRADLVDAAQAVCPESYAISTKSLVRNGATLVLGIQDNDALTGTALMIRQQIAAELNLTSVHELALLDTAIDNWIKARRASIRAAKASTPGDYARLMSVAQAADRLFSSTIQFLRNRHQPTVRVMQVSGTNVAIQVNEGQASAASLSPARSKAPRESESSGEAAPHYFGKK